MILTAQELRRYVTTDEDDQALEAKLSALELLVRGYTNNNFQMRAFRKLADTAKGRFITIIPHTFKAGDTVQVSGSDFNNGIYEVVEAEEHVFTVNADTTDEEDVLVTKVVYPMDVKMGVVDLMKWELNRREKVGVAAETISRHSVTYESMTDDNSIMGYPKALMGFLKPYMKARFGQGVR